MASTPGINPDCGINIHLLDLGEKDGLVQGNERGLCLPLQQTLPTGSKNCSCNKKNRKN
jgi:hypothetical protein